MSKVCNRCSVKNRGICKGSNIPFKYCLREIGHLDVDHIRQCNSKDEIIKILKDKKINPKEETMCIKPYYGDTKILVSEIKEYSNGAVPVSYIMTNETILR